MFHGSHKNIRGKYLKPHPSCVVDGEEKVFASPNRDFALQYIGRKWDSGDMESGTMHGNRFMIEKKPGAYRRIYGGTGGYLYIVEGESFHTDPRLGSRNDERVSDCAVRIIEKVKIPNAWEALNSSDILLFKYGDLRFVDFVLTGDRALDLTSCPFNEYHMQTLVALNKKRIRVKVSSVNYERVNRYLWGARGIHEKFRRIGYVFHDGKPYYCTWGEPTRDIGGDACQTGA
jgi:hypothetical protein